MPTYSGASPTLTVQALLKQPTRISRQLANLVYQRLIADRIMVTGTPDQVAGGAMQYQQAESIFVDLPRDVEEIAQRGDWPRASWTEQLLSALVKQYGLEVPINNLAIRRNQMDQVIRAERKLANNIVKFIDTQAMALLTDTAQGITSQAASAAWTTAGTDIISDVATAQETIETQNNGYNGFESAVLVLHTTRRKALLNNTVLRNALPREDRQGQITTGMMAPFMGLREILFTSTITASQALILDATIAATIADEQPDPAEGFTAYDPGPAFKPIYVKVYEEGRPKDKIVAAGRWPAMALTDPKAVVLITGV